MGIIDIYFGEIVIWLFILVWVQNKLTKLEQDWY